MNEYVIIEGGVKTPEGMKGPGDVVKLSDADRKAMDPQGTAFMEKAKYDAKKRAEAAAAAELAKAGLKPEESKKGGK